MKIFEIDEVTVRNIYMALDNAVFQNIQHGQVSKLQKQLENLVELKKEVAENTSED